MEVLFRRRKEKATPWNNKLSMMGLQKSTTRAQKIADFSSSPYHNLVTIYTSRTKYLPLLQNSMGYLMQFAEIEYYNHS